MSAETFDRQIRILREIGASDRTIEVAEAAKAAAPAVETNLAWCGYCQRSWPTSMLDVRGWLACHLSIECPSERRFNPKLWPAMKGLLDA